MADGDPLVAAIQWLVALLMGKAATSVAVIAVASIGFAMLQGRIAHREGFRVIIGCGILFGAPVIANRLMEIADGSGSDLPISSPPPPVPLSIPTYKSRQPTYDPYAGAVVPQ